MRAGLNAMTAYAGVLASRGEEDAILELRDLAMYMREFWQDFLYAIYEKAGARTDPLSRGDFPGCPRTGR